MLKMNFLFALIFLMFSCSYDDGQNSIQPITDPPNAIGTVYFISKLNIEDSYAKLKTSLQQNKNISIVAELDHSQNAASVGVELAPTRIIFFGNPNLGTPLMQENQLAGLDLPQRVLFYEEEGEVFALYNSTKYMASRYDVDGVETLPQISEALTDLVGSAVNAQGEENENQNVDRHEGIISVESTTGFEATYANLRSSIEDNDNLSIVAELNHRENAESVGMELRPTRLIMFGNPNLGTPLMQSNRSIGLDLPQKMLVWEAEDGTVNISFNNPEFLKERHHISGNSEEIAQIKTALEMLSNSAAGR